MKNAELNIVLFDEHDVIATSGFVLSGTLSGLQDGIESNISFGEVKNDSQAFNNTYGEITFWNLETGDAAQGVQLKDYEDNPNYREALLPLNGNYVWDSSYEAYVMQ